MYNYPRLVLATNLVPDQVVSLDPAGVQHVIENVEQGDTLVRVEFTDGLRAVWPVSKLVTVVGVKATKAPDRSDPAPAKPVPEPKRKPKPAPKPERLASLDIHVNTGDILQITNPEHHWYPCLAIVDESKPWGCMAYCLIPHNDGTKTGIAPIRLQSRDYEWVGTVAIARASE